MRDADRERATSAARAALAFWKVAAPMKPMTFLQVARAVVRQRPFDISHLAVETAFQWGKATAEILRRRRVRWLRKLLRETEPRA
jgi:hypothetical protein